MWQGLPLPQLEAILNQDPRLNELEKYWLQFSSSDLDKLVQFYRLIELTSYPAALSAAPTTSNTA